MKPLVSVVMPTYNGEKYIEQAIESIISQTYCNWELIIIDDCSIDNTAFEINKFQDSRIKVFKNHINKGISYSTNRGIQESKGKYIALLDHDDLAESNRLQLQVTYLEEHSEIDLLGGRTIFIDESGKRIRYGEETRNNHKYIKAMLLFNSLDFMNSTVMMRKEFLERNNLYYEENCYGMQDYHFFIECSKVGKISSIDEFLVRHRYHETNETKRCLENYFDERKQTYADFQRYSMKKSGFVLEEQEMKLINKVFAEMDGRCNSLEEVKKLYEVLQKILRQAREMDIEYYDELKHLCKVKINKQLMNFDYFN